jgi:hypothetical protein
MAAAVLNTHFCRNLAASSTGGNPAEDRLTRRPEFYDSMTFNFAFNFRKYNGSIIILCVNYIDKSYLTLDLLLISNKFKIRG